MQAKLHAALAAIVVLAQLSCGGSGGSGPGPEDDEFDWRDAVVYHVELDRFLNGNPGNDQPTATVDPAANYHGGDLAGLLQQLQGGFFGQLGVNVICLSSPTQGPTGSALLPDGHAGAGYHGDWPTDPGAVDARFGTMAQLQAVTDAAHAKGIRVIVEYVAKHVHSSSATYVEHTSWFSPLCVLGTEDCAWTGPDRRTGWIADYLPSFDYTGSSAVAWSVDRAVTFVTTAGVDGLVVRWVDVMDTSFLEALRTALAGQRSRTGSRYVLFGEFLSDDPGRLAAYVAPATLLDGQLDEPLRAAILKAVAIRDTSFDMSDLGDHLAGQAARYSGVMATALGRADMPRPIHFAQDAPLWTSPHDSGADRAWAGQPTSPTEASAYDRAGLAMAVAFGVPGMPWIYYGDEIGMPGAGIPDNRRPMVFSDAALSSDQLRLRAEVAQLATIRAAHPALRRGSWSLVAQDADTLVWRMAAGEDVVFVAANRSDAEKEVGGLPAQVLNDELGGESVTGPAVTVPARSARFLVAP